MPTNKHFINDQTRLVIGALRAATYVNPSLSLDEANRVIYCTAPDPHRVAVVSGGGAGHEPSFASYVGDGMLRAAVAGTVFASPSVRQISSCVSRCGTGSAGVLLVVMNYTGDVLHFGLATEKARTMDVAAGAVEMVVVGDDVGVGRARSGRVGRRGMAGTVLVHKTAGALAAIGATLAQCAALARLVAANLVTLGASLARVHVPGSAAIDDDDGCALGPDEMELGMGIHNERGCRRMPVPRDVGELVDTMLRQLLDEGDADRNYLGCGGGRMERGLEVVLLINNLGGVSPLELGAITAEVVERLSASYAITPKRVYSGTFMTSLDGPGFSVTLLRLVPTGLGVGRDMLGLLDAAHATHAWAASTAPPALWARPRRCAHSASPPPPRAGPGAGPDSTPASGLTMCLPGFARTVRAGLERVVAAEPELTRYDTLVGDGDCGTGLKRGAEAVLAFLCAPDLATGAATADPAAIVARLAAVVEDSMDGTSGALTSIFLHALAKALRDAAPAPKQQQQPRVATATTADIDVWSAAALHAMAGLGRYTPAQPGDRTMMDALVPGLHALAEQHDLAAAARAARAGAERTRRMAPRLGRTVYIDRERVGDVPDPGAVGVAVLLEGMAAA